MSIDATKWVNSIQGLSGAEKSVLRMIADHFNENDLNARPGRALLARETGYSVRTVSRVVSKLNRTKFKGTETRVLQIQRWIDPSTGQNLANRYFLPAYNPESGRNEPEVKHVGGYYQGVNFIIEDW
jgi:AraC-like DNA-binding protein